MACKYMSRCPSATGWCNRKELDYETCIPFLLSAIESREERIRDLEAEAPKARILYRCDQRACDSCSGECFHTENIRHARNFSLCSGSKGPLPTFVED